MNEWMCGISLRLMLKHCKYDRIDWLTDYKTDSAAAAADSGGRGFVA